MIKYCKGHLQPDSFLLKNSNDIVPLTVDCLAGCHRFWQSACLPACLPICLSFCLSLCLSVCLSVYLSACLPVYPCVSRLPIHPSAHLPGHLSVSPLACLSFHVLVCLSSIHPSALLAACFSVHPPVCRSVRLSVGSSLPLQSTV